MTVIDNYKNENKIIGTRNVLVGVKIDGRSREVLSWALVKVAEPGDSVVAIHVSRNPDHARKGKPLLDEYLDVYEGLCSVKKVGLSGQIITGSSVRKSLVKEAQNYTDVTLVLGISKKTTLGRTRGSTSVAKYCAKKFCSTTDVLAVHNGKIIFSSCTRNQLPGSEGDPKPSLGSRLREAYQSEFGESECDTETVFSFSTGVSRSPSWMDPAVAVPGWPLLRRNPRAPRTRNMSVVQWVMSLPDRSPIRCPTITEDEAHATLLRLSSFVEAPGERLQSLVRENSFGCKWYPLDLLKTSTCGFSTERLVGKGGCNRVYKGVFPGGKSVAVKILESSRQDWKIFALEFDIMSCLSHKNIAPLLGVCVQDDALISVYDFLPNGNLEENLHGKNRNKLALSWEVRYRIALGIAEALHYLHKECPQTVIHRDIKSSNILLSDDLEPKLSDFGLAIWGPKGSNFITEEDVVGTFGYLAPEYFMYGKVSDKIDGVVLLELLSGRRPIGTDVEAAKGQDSLVMWAKPRIEKGDVKGLLDPDLDGKVDEAQIHRMAIAASLCITRSGRLRPNIAQVLKILKGEKEDKNLCSLKNNFHHELENRDDDNNNDDEVYPDSSAELHLGVALLNIDDDSMSFNSSNNLTLDDYFNERWSRSSSFD